MNKFARLLVAISATALSACAAGMQQQAVGPASAGPPAAGGSVPIVAGVNPFETRRQRMVPLIDAHQHLMGPAAMTTLQRSAAPPSITVPLPIQRLLDKRRNGVNANNFSSIYTADAQHFSQEQGRWWTGKDQILDAASNFGFHWRLDPTSYSASGRSGFVSGLIRNATGAETYDFVLGRK